MVKDNIERDDDAKVKRPDSLEKADVRSYNEKITAILEYLKYRGYGEYLKQDSTPIADRAIMEMPTPPAAIVLQDVDQVGLSADELNARRSANRDAISVHTDATRKYAADLETFGKANEVIQRFNQRNADLRTGHQKAIGVCLFSSRSSDSAKQRHDRYTSQIRPYSTSSQPSATFI